MPTITTCRAHWENETELMVELCISQKKHPRSASAPHKFDLTADEAMELTAQIGLALIVERANLLELD